MLSGHARVGELLKHVGFRFLSLWICDSVFSEVGRLLRNPKLQGYVDLLLYLSLVVEILLHATLNLHGTPFVNQQSIRAPGQVSRPAQRNGVLLRC